MELTVLFLLNLYNHVSLKTAPFQLVQLSSQKRTQFLDHVPTLNEPRKLKSLIKLILGNTKNLKITLYMYSLMQM